MLFFLVPAQANPQDAEATNEASRASFEVLGEGNSEILSTIPRIGGAWDTVITGVPHNGVPHTMRGTTTFDTYIAPDGYEVLTRMHAVMGLYDPQGRLVDTAQDSINISNGKITSTRFSITHVNTGIYTIHSSVYMTRTTNGSSAQGTYTRGGGEGASSGGGCSVTGGTSPLVVLLALPTLLLYFK